MAGLKEFFRARPDFVASVGYLFVRLIAVTLRIETAGFETGCEKTIFCGWHGRTFVFANRFRRRGWWVIVSQSRDGEIQTGLFSRLGFQVARGSTGRGGERAAVRTIKALRAGGTLAMTPDGPRGPAQVVQPGILLIAQKSGARLVPVGTSATRYWTLRSWDAYKVPKPFARCLVQAGEALTVPRDAVPDEIEAIRVELEKAISSIQDATERAIRGR